jgi:hypothetical protein
MMISPKKKKTHKAPLSLALTEVSALPWSTSSPAKDCRYGIPKSKKIVGVVLVAHQAFVVDYHTPPHDDLVGNMP